MLYQNKCAAGPALGATGLLTFTGVLVETAMNVTFPTLTQRFAISTAAVQWVTTINLLAIAAVIPASAWLIRHLAPRRLFMAANGLFLTGSILNSVAAVFPLLLLGRFLQGLSTGIALPLLFHLILSYVPRARRGLFMGLGIMTTSVAPVFGPAYGGVMTQHFSWQGIFAGTLPVILLSLLLGWQALPKERPQTSPGRFNWPALVWLALAFSFLLESVSSGRLVLQLAGLLLTAVMTGGFVRLNQRQPLLNLAVLRNRRFAALMAGLLIYQSLLLSLSFVLANYLQVTAGYSAGIAGAFMIPGALAAAALAPLSGRLLDKLGAGIPVVAGIALAFTGLLLLLAALPKHQLLPMIACHLLLMTGLGLSNSNLMTCSLNALAPEQVTDGNAVINTLQQLAGALGTAAAAQIMARCQTDLGLESGTAWGSYLTLSLLALLLLLSLVNAWRQPPRTADGSLEQTATAKPSQATGKQTESGS